MWIVYLACTIGSLYSKGVGRQKIQISEASLRELYLVKNWTPRKIGLQFKCDGITVRNRLKELKILFKTKSSAQTRYARHDFDGTEAERAYILGFRYGDLNVYKPKGKSETLVVRCHTTHTVQEDLFKKLFSRYGTITVSRNSRSMHMNCYLNFSFNFLLQKYNDLERAWLKKCSNRMWAFIAGYIDAEGTFGIYEGRGRFKIDAYDVLILKDMHDFLVHNGIRSIMRIVVRKGQPGNGSYWNNDVWRVNVNEVNSLAAFVTKLLPFLMHKKRVQDARAVLKNVLKRQLNGTIKTH